MSSCNRNRTGRTSFIKVQVGELPGQIKEYALNGGRSVEDALSVAGLSLDDESQIRVNGNRANSRTQLRNGDCVLLVEAIEGN
jgi:hypothetical protein